MSTKTEKQEQEAIEAAETLPSAIKTMCLSTIEAAMAAYWKKGGVAELKNKLQAILEPFQTKLREDMRLIAEGCYREAGGHGREAIVLFEGACYQMKTRALQLATKSGMEDARIQQVLPDFTPTKSQIIGFIKAGKDFFATEPVKVKNEETGEVTETEKRLYPSMTEIRRAVANNRRDSKSDDATGKGKGSSVGVSDIANAFKATPQLSAVLNDMAKQLRGSSEEAQDFFAVQLNAAVVALVAFRTNEDNEKSDAHVGNVAPASAQQTKKERAKRGVGTAAGVSA